MRVLTQTLPALTKGSLPFRLAIPETFSSVFRWALMSTLPEALVAGYRQEGFDANHVTLTTFRAITQRFTSELLVTVAIVQHGIGKFNGGSGGVE